MWTVRATAVVSAALFGGHPGPHRQEMETSGGGGGSSSYQPLRPQHFTLNSPASYARFGDSQRSASSTDIPLRFAYASS